MHIMSFLSVQFPKFIADVNIFFKEKIPFILVTYVKNKYDIQKEQEKASSWLISRYCRLPGSHCARETDGKPLSASKAKFRGFFITSYRKPHRMCI